MKGLLAIAIGRPRDDDSWNARSGPPPRTTSPGARTEEEWRAVLRKAGAE